MKQFKIQIITYLYIQQTLRFAPATDRQLRRHMRRRKDFQSSIDRLLAEGKILKGGKGVKGDPVTYYSAQTHYKS